MPLGGALDVAFGDDGGEDGAGEDGVGDGDEVVEEPGAAGSEKATPVVAEDQAVGDAAADGAAAVQDGVEHLDAPVEDGDGEDDADAKADAPEGGFVVEGGGLEHDEEDGGGEGDAEG